MATKAPRLESLEDRLAPAIFGNPWPDATRLSVSFVPGGDGAAPPGWQTEVLRALQSWASVGNVNLVVVNDSGDPLGTPGLIQGDPRFGDVRVAWAPLGVNSLATSVPFSPTAGTWSGDVVLNSSATFGPGGYDPYSVVLHEAGHVFGVPGEDADPSDVMFEWYNGVRPGLGAADVAAMQALYGARPDDAFEGAGASGNGTLATATDFQGAATATARAAVLARDEDATLAGDRLAVAADLKASDVDVYSYRTTAGAPGFSLRLSARDHSLLSARLTVLDESGRVIASSVADRTADAVVRVDAGRSQRLFFRVESADAAFGVGAYALELTPDNPSALAPLRQVVGRYLNNGISNDRLETASPLAPNPESGPAQLTFAHAGTIGAGDVDYYQASLSGGPAALDVWLSGGPGMSVTVLDGSGQALASATTDGVLAHLRLDAVASSTVYFRVSGGSGTYFLLAQLGAPPVVTTPATAGVLDAQLPQTTRGLVLSEATLLHVELEAQTLGSVETSVEATLFDESGNVVFRQTVKAGQTVAANLFLQAGQYTWRFVAGTADGSALAETTFAVRQLVLNDPIGPALIDPTHVPPPAEPLWLPSGFARFLALLDPYGRPLSPIALPPGM
jgi:hypothetical protein